MLGVFGDFYPSPSSYLIWLCFLWVHNQPPRKCDASREAISTNAFLRSSIMGETFVRLACATFAGLDEDAQLHSVPPNRNVSRLSAVPVRT